MGSDGVISHTSATVNENFTQLLNMKLRLMGHNVVVMQTEPILFAVLIYCLFQCNLLKQIR